MKESLVDLHLTLVADGQPSKVVQPGQRALNYPPVPAKPFTAFNPSSRDTWGDPSFSQGFPALVVVVPLVSVQLHRPPYPASSPSAKTCLLLDGLDSIHHFHKHCAVMDIGTGADYRERDPLPVDHKMALRARFASIRRRRPGSFAPFLAGTLAESTDARVQSILPASPNLSSRSWCRRSHTPASCQSRRRRQQVMPLPQPISGGSISHGRPLLSTKMMPVSAARLGTRGRLPFGFSGSGGNSGSTTSQSSSLTIGFAIPDSTGFGRF
jgi:hypothetical protein